MLYLYQKTRTIWLINMTTYSDKKLWLLPDELPVNEMFYSLQGEGHHAGLAAFFVRLAGCEVGCPWCDTKESWKVDENQIIKLDAILKAIALTRARSVVVTGGEPTLYALDRLCKALKNNDLKVFLETSGVYPLTGTWDWVCLSPKNHRQPLTEIYRRADELKIVISTDSDVQWAEENARKVSATCQLYLQADWNNDEKMIPFLINYIKNHPQWKLSLQTHKLLNIR